jgi:hypothetical protein
MNYDIYINEEFWQTLVYPEAVTLGVVGTAIDQARQLGSAPTGLTKIVPRPLD